jgi:hypothetical protein
MNRNATVFDDMVVPGPVPEHPGPAIMGDKGDPGSNRDMFANADQIGLRSEIGNAYEPAIISNL